MPGESKQPFWERTYGRKGRMDTFCGGKPSPDVVLAASKLMSGAQALDMGCGEGRNSIHLAKSGLDTTAIDISKPGINKLKTVAVEMGLKIDASVCDMRDFQFTKKYDLILNHGCLYYICCDEWMELVDKMKKATVIGGYHVIDVFIDEIPEPEDQRGMMVGIFKKGELAELYKDWEIIESKSYRLDHTHPDGPTHKHAGESIVVRKIKNE